METLRLLGHESATVTEIRSVAICGLDNGSLTPRMERWFRRLSAPFQPFRPPMTKAEVLTPVLRQGFEPRTY